MDLTPDAPALSAGAPHPPTSDRPLLINVRGTNGSGKSTLVREVMARCAVTPEFIDGRRKPIGYTCVRPDGRTLYVPGHYETPCGGCDTITRVDGAYALIRRAAGAGHDVLFEGVIVQDDVRRCVELHREMAASVLVLFLDVNIDECLASVRARRVARGDGRPFNSTNTINRAKKLARIAVRLVSAGVRVEHADRAGAMETVLRALGLTQNAKPMALVRLADADHASLPSLAAAIRIAVAQAEDAARSALDYARQAGELLNEAKARLRHGEWMVWLADHCQLSTRVAQNYMDVARNWDRIVDWIANTNSNSYLTLTDALAVLRSGRKEREDAPTGALALPAGADEDSTAPAEDDGLDLDLAPGGHPAEPPSVPAAPEPKPPTTYARPVQLLLDGATYAEFTQQLADLGPALQTTGTQATVLEAVRYAHRAVCSPAAESIAC